MMYNVFCFLVGKLTISSKLLSDTMSRNDWLTLDGYWFPVMVWSFQSMSGRLKSPAIIKMRFLACFLRVRKSSLTDDR